jgi:hypothetical protein
MNRHKERIRNAIEADKNHGMLWHLARYYALWAELFKRKGDLQNSDFQFIVEGIISPSILKWVSPILFCKFEKFFNFFH